MPRDRECHCGGTGRDGCVIEPNVDEPPDILERLRQALLDDIDRLPRLTALLLEEAALKQAATIAALLADKSNVDSGPTEERTAFRLPAPPLAPVRDHLDLLSQSADKEREIKER